MTGIHITTTKKLLGGMVDNQSKGFVVFEKIDKSYDGEVLVVKNLNLCLDLLDQVKQLH